MAEMRHEAASALGDMGAPSGPVTSPGDPGGGRVTLKRWWRFAIVRDIDHAAVIDRVIAESGFSGRYIFMTAMSAGIAVLGLLLSSPAVVIGAMLISPLMGPILGLGFGMATFDSVEIRRSLAAVSVGTLAAVLFTAAIVMASPLREPTAEIIARTRPTLFDLLVALFAALAGTYAIIRGRGETIVGVAIATALMPPLAVVGYGLATWNMPVLAGSSALFLTNLVTIALSAMVMARVYGFGHRLSAKQSWTQTAVLVLLFVAMAVPLAVSLRQIARESLTGSVVRKTLSQRLGTNARVTELDIDFDAEPLLVRAVLIIPRDQVKSVDALREELEKALARPVELRVDHVVLAAGASELEAQRAELRTASEARAQARAADDAAARAVAVAAGVPFERVMVDQGRRRIGAVAAPLPGAHLATYRALEQRALAAAPGWEVVLIPPPGELPAVVFVDGASELDPAGRDAVRLSAWAARRWSVDALAVPGLPDTVPQDVEAAAGVPSTGGTPRAVRAPGTDLAAARALAISAVLQEQGIRPIPAPAAEGDIVLSPPVPGVPSP